MSAENFKGKLQEKFPKDDINYHTWRVGGSDHEPLWQSTVSVGLVSHTSPTPGQTSKVKAEQAAAQKALEHINCVQTDERDIDLVQTQANCTRQLAVAALEANRGDVVEAIMSLMA